MAFRSRRFSFIVLMTSIAIATFPSQCFIINRIDRPDSDRPSNNQSLQNLFDNDNRSGVMQTMPLQTEQVRQLNLSSGATVTRLDGDMKVKSVDMQLKFGGVSVSQDRGSIAKTGMLSTTTGPNAATYRKTMQNNVQPSGLPLQTFQSVGEAMPIIRRYNADLGGQISAVNNLPQLSGLPSQNSQPVGEAIPIIKKYNVGLGGQISTVNTGNVQQPENTPEDASRKMIVLRFVRALRRRLIMIRKTGQNPEEEKKNTQPSDTGIPNKHSHDEDNRGKELEKLRSENALLKIQVERLRRAFVAVFAAYLRSRSRVNKHENLEGSDSTQSDNLAPSVQFKPKIRVISLKTGNITADSEASNGSESGFARGESKTEEKNRQKILARVYPSN